MATHVGADSESTTRGFVLGVAAYGMWAVLPVYFKAVGEVSALEVLCHRIVWSVVLLGVIAALSGLWPQVRALLRDRRTLGLLAISTALVACNWFVYIWAVAEGYIVQASLGYYINPLMNVFLGVVFLSERLSRLGWMSVALAGFGVVYIAVIGGELPWISLLLATSFALYGLVRKVAKVGAVVGLWVETLFVGPLALAYLAVLASDGSLAFTASAWHLDLLLILAGAVTALPLMCFTAAARILPLSTMGFLQYIAPSGQLLLAVLVYDEAFSLHQAVTFACIWTALLLFSGEQIALRRAGKVA